jgi:hypothetical protein
MMPGFTRIPNDDVFDNSLWTADKFTKGQAFIDLYRLAQFKEGIVHKRGIFIQLKPGQIGWSIVEFGKRWKWSIGKVKRFLKYLKKVGQIELQNTNVSTTITLLHWINNDTANSTANGKQTVLQTESKRYPYNIDKIDKIDNTGSKLMAGKIKIIQLVDYNKDDEGYKYFSVKDLSDGIIQDIYFFWFGNYGSKNGFGPNIKLWKEAIPKNTG